MIEIEGLTKDYGNGLGIFDISLEVKKGETFALCGINGAGKTTLIRHIMGFIKADRGNASIDGIDCFKNAHMLKKRIGYLPGEIALPSGYNGKGFLKRQADLIGLKDFTYINKLILRLQLNSRADLKRMSKGMKQKTAIIAAFMHNPDILILDEPTTGLDPLMRATFIDFINEEKAEGKTIFMSSHMFDEIESICDRVAFLKEGRIIKLLSVNDIINSKNKRYRIEFNTVTDYANFLENSFNKEEINQEQKQTIIKINDSEINKLTYLLKDYDIKSFSEMKDSLESYFYNTYKENSDAK